MRQRIHFISGLPRSGSTLLAALLLQNPRFYASMTSPVGGLFQANLQLMSAGSEIGLLVNEEQRPVILKALFSAFYDHLTDHEVVFDTNRTWCSKLPALLTLFPEAKIICCVRNVAWVMDSLERIIRRNPFENSRLFANDTERATVFSRVDTLANRDRLVGFAWSALKEAYYGEHARSLLIVEYELLTQAPHQVLPLVYQFLEEPLFDHDYDNVEFDAPTFDQALGLTGLHRVRPQVRFQPRRTILPPDLFAKYEGLSFWRNQSGSSANVIAVKQAEGEMIGRVAADTRSIA